MKKTFLFSLGIIAAFAFLFVSCGDKNNDANIGGTGSGGDVLICKVSVSNTEGGSAKITSYIGASANVLIGNGVEVVAVPDDGYNFIGWFVGGSKEPVSVDETFTFIASENITLLAKFEKSFAVSAKSSGGGTVSFKDIADTSLKDVLIGSEVTVIAVPDENCDFLGWFVGDSEEPVSIDATYTFTVSENVTLFAKFNQWPLVSISSGAYGSVSFENSAETSLFVQSGSEVTVIATPAENTDFLGWFVGDSEEPVSIDATYTFTVSENVTLFAKFNQWPLVSIRSRANGSVSFENSAETSLFVQSGSEVTVIAIPDVNCDFLGWFIGGGKEPVSTDATYTFTVSENVSLVAKFKGVPINGHEYVDLGLPSGLKWATCNVGASSPEEYGGYYAWGETEEKSNYGWSTYKWCNGSYNSMTKYCTDSDYGTFDDKTVLDPEDDVAHVKWGGSWRMPTGAEQEELHNNCTWIWTAQNGVNGYKVTGPNGNSIFLPAAGRRSGTGVRDGGSRGYYWSSSLYNNGGSACCLCFFGSNYYWHCFIRYYGQSIRPVSK